MKNPEEAVELRDDPYFVGDEFIRDFQTYEHNDFATEKDLCNFIQHHAQQFAEDILGIEYKSHQREYVMSRGIRKRARVDFIFNEKNSPVIVECKNPTQKYHELTIGLAQLMAYSLLEPDARLVLVTSTNDPVLNMVINKFNLPIELIIFSKSHVMKLVTQ